MVIAGALLDHVAIGVEDTASPRAWLTAIGAVRLPAEDLVGFSAQQWVFASGMRMEIIAPLRPERNDFLERFIRRNGPGPHHVTFLVDDLAAAIIQAEDAGFPILSSNFDQLGWFEAFLHPRNAFGVVLQLVQSSGWDLPEIAEPTADLPLINVEVSDLDRALSLYQDLLGGAAIVDVDGVHVLSWPGTGSIALHQGDATRHGRVASLVVSGPEVTGGFQDLLGVEFRTR